MSARGLACAALIALGGAAWAGTGPARAGLTEDLRYKMAVKAAQERRWDKARALFGALREAYPQDDRAAVQLGQVELETGRDARAQAIALELLAKDPTDRFAKSMLERLRRKVATPEPPLTFGDEPDFPATWERGDEFHLGVPVLTRAGGLSILEPRLVEGPPPAMPEPAPAVRYRLRFEVPGGSAGEVAIDPALGPTALVERPGADGKLTGELVSLPPGHEMPKEAFVSFYLGAVRLVVLDPAGVRRAERAVPVAEVHAGLMGLARPPRVPGLGAPLAFKPPEPSRLVPLARLSARLKPEYSPGGQPAGMWLRIRLVGELFVYPALRALPDAEVPRACPYLLWPLEPPGGTGAVDALAQKLAAYLDRPGNATRFSAVAAFRPFADRLERELLPELERYRAAVASPEPGAAPAPPGSVGMPTTSPSPSPAASPAPMAATARAAPGAELAAARELRGLVNLVLISGRLTRLTQESEASGIEARSRAAEALVLISRFRIERK